MENLFIGFRVNNRLYGAKSYLADEKEWSASHEMITGFYHRNNLSQMKNLFDLISWESVRSSKRINNGFTFMALLKEDTIEGFAYYRKDIRSKISKKNKKESLYDASCFEERNGQIFAVFTNHGEIYDEYQFEKTYIIDLDKDQLVIENSIRK